MRFKEFLDLQEEVTQAELDAVEKYADRLFAKAKVDVAFTKHFKDRVNDARNKPAITSAELVRIFKQTWKTHGKKIAQIGPDAEGIIKDMLRDLNMPFVIKYDRRNQEFDLISKTIMRKKDFKSNNPGEKILHIK